LEDQSSGAEYKSFDAYLAPNLVQSLILNHYLRQIEQSASRYLPSPAP
jgi:hypothetical protein